MTSRWVHDDWMPFEMPRPRYGSPEAAPPLDVSFTRFDLPSAASLPLQGQPVEVMTPAEAAVYDEGSV